MAKKQSDGRKRPRFKIRIKIKKADRAVLVKSLFLTFMFFSACILGALFGAYFAVRQNLPDIAGLETFAPNLITTVYSDEGEAIKDFAIERRIEVPYEQIPDPLKKAIIATEDPRFYSHRGIDFWGILRAFKENLKLKRGLRRFEGGSTITQQLARLLFLYPQQTVERKLKEWFLSLRIEKRYSKERILEMYCNQFYLGHGVYGVETASNLFFGKTVSDLALEEAAMIAGIFRGPSVYSPYTNHDLTLRRRNHVLSRMAEEGFITRQEAEEARQIPMKVLPLRRGALEFGAYFFEEVRKYIERKYGSDALYRAGLKVHTTLNPKLQKHAEDALFARLREMDKMHGWRKDKKNILETGAEKLDEIWLESWITPVLQEAEYTEAIVLSVSRNEAAVKAKTYTGKLTNENIAWTKTNNMEKLIKAGDVVLVKIRKVDLEKKEFLASLDQEPQVEGSFLAIVPQTGQIKAMVGGYSFRRSKFNRATQALRQAGSAIKPFLYTAALENGFTPASIIVDEPTEFIDKWTGEPWSPPNYDRKYKGSVTLRKGMEESRNIVTAKLLDYISPQTGVDFCRKFGITSTIYPYLSLSLGTFEVTLLEMVSAYTTFPNKGIHVKPSFITRIEDKEGNILEEAKVESENVISPQTAFLMTYLLQGVVQRGTGSAASSIEKSLAGKTGTTDEYTDAWFIGFSPSLCAGVWVGHDTKITLGERQAGAVAALPVWTEFFKKAVEDEKRTYAESGVEPVAEEFEVPPNIVFVEIDRKTGLLAAPICLWPFREAFLPGTEPLRFCSHEDHMMILDYYGTEKAAEEHN